MTKYLVTGGAGYIGSNLVSELTRDSQNQIVCLDNYSTGTTANHIKNVKYIKAETKDINRVLDWTPDVVYHLGEYSRVEQSYEDIEQVWNSNVFGTYEVLKFCKEHHVKLIYSGSSTKFSTYYGSENHSPYGWTKASNTELVKRFGEWFNLDYAIVYFYNVFGRNEIKHGKYSTVIAKFIEAMKVNAELTVVKPGSQERNFTYIDDIVLGLRLVEQFGSGDGYAIGSDKSYSIEKIAKTFGGKIKYLNERPGNRMRAELDTSKMASLGWSTTVDVIEYINSLKLSGWQPDE